MEIIQNLDNYNLTNVKVITGNTWMLKMVMEEASHNSTKTWVNNSNLVNSLNTKEELSR